MSGGRDRFLYLGLDAFDPDLLRAGAADGTFPALRDLLARGTAAPVENPTGLYVGAVWPSFWTSRSAARHGRYCFRQLVPGTYRERAVRSADVTGPPFWWAFGAAGRTSHVFDVPKVAPDLAIRGEHVVDWGTHDPDPAGFVAHPPALAEEVRASIGPPRNDACDRLRSTAAEYRALADGLVERIRRRESWLLGRLASETDAVIACHTESHCVGHQAWHLHDPTHERHDRRVAEEAGDVLLEVYRAIDASVGRLVAAARGRHVLVHASHGMGPHHDGNRALDEMLERLEPVLPAGLPPTLGARFARVVDRRRTRKWSRRLLRRFGRPLPIPSRHAGALCFTVTNNDAWAGVRVNVAGREPAGRVPAGAALEAFVAALCARLAEVRHGETGEPVFDRILPTRDVHPRTPGDALPDVLARWRRGVPIPSLRHPAVGRTEGRYKGLRTGDHRDDGLAIAVGPGIEAGRVADRVRVEDLGPTLGCWLGVPVPDVDGRPVDAWCPARTP